MLLINLKIEKLSILSQLLLLILPLITLIICVSFYFQYQSSLHQFIKQEEQRKENIKSGMKLFIDNYDLSLKLVEIQLDDRIRQLSTKILSEHSFNLNTADLNTLRLELNMDEQLEHLYIIDSKGIVVNTTKKADFGLNFFEFGNSYKTFLKDVWAKKTLVIERVATENTTKKPIKYAYQAINDDFILEIGIQYKSVDSLVGDFSSKIKSLSSKYSNIRSINLYGATEALPSRNLGGKMDELTKPVAIKCFENKRDSSILSSLNGAKIKTELIYLNMRGSAYFNGYILQIVSDDSLKKALLIREFKQFISVLVITLLLISVLLYFSTKKITQPIRYLSKQVSDISNNEKITELKVNGNKEVTLLVREFNSLLTEIKENQQTLETKIKERTAQISTKSEELEKLLEERELLIKEIHHRVKNNLQIISSLLNLQASKVKSEEAIIAFEESKSRVSAMALLHEKLYKNTNFVTINASDYLQSLIDVLKNTIRKNITITVKNSDVVYNSSESISIGLITNEAIINSLKHAFNSEEKGVIKIETSHTKTDVILTIHNDGKKLLENYDSNNSDSLGMTIIEAFSEKLDGNFVLENVENGVLLTVTFPKKFSRDFF